MYETITTNAATGVQPRTGNWATRGTVAAGRGIALVGLTLVGLVLWVVFATAVALAPLGIGLPAIPVTELGRNARSAARASDTTRSSPTRAASERSGRTSWYCRSIAANRGSDHSRP